MLPYFEFIGLTWHTNTLLAVISSFLSLGLLIHLVPSLKTRTKVLLWALIIISSIFGARAFHVFFERLDYFIQYPKLAFTRLDGMTFYGSFIAGAVTISLFNRGKDQQTKTQVWNVAILSMLLTYGIMRLGCFCNGCCWGGLCRLPWAVRYYHELSVMPFKGIPVHPVQLYDSMGGFVLFLVLWFNRKKWWNHLTLYGVIGYSCLRFTTEFFRGDRFRGENLAGTHLSTSQIISITLLVISVIIIFVSKEKEHEKSPTSLF